MKRIIKDDRSITEIIVSNCNAQKYLDRKWDVKVNKMVKVCGWSLIASMIIFVLIVSYFIAK